jgi:Uma2 family endonuclease
MVTEVVENQTQACGFTPEVSLLPKTYEEFSEWNGTNDIWAEWENGEIIYISNPSLRHQDISDFLTADLVIEIISPESRTRDKADKFYEYEQAAVKEYWLIDPDRKRTEFYTLGDDGFFNFEIPENGVFKSKILAGMN